MISNSRIFYLCSHSLITQVLFLDSNRLYVLSKNQIKIVDIYEKRVVKTFSDRSLDDNKTCKLLYHPLNFLLAANTSEDSTLFSNWTIDGKVLKKEVDYMCSKFKQLCVLSNCIYGLSNDKNGIISFQVEITGSY